MEVGAVIKGPYDLQGQNRKGYRHAADVLGKTHMCHNDLRISVVFWNQTTSRWGALSHALQRRDAYMLGRFSVVEEGYQSLLNLCRSIPVGARAAARVCEARGRHTRGSKERGSSRSLSFYAAAWRSGNATSRANARCM